ncbi:NERD domain-containing protein [Halobacillus litoralis]|uniref:nuclease-related domain-containing protein n=1 Tax=Halobacillus litoralis TaxID=45668 RepID=UPI001CD59149|nr:nuclease-related domain-containing protein [Halobacillus litoralis]MCA0971495.1 NERD domain-containing protein [Halobacillus litoralis]
MIKERTPSQELLTLRSLNLRMNLTDQQKKKLLRLESGYEGELKFDQMLKQLGQDKYVLCDLMLEIDGSYFQIDTVIITSQMIYFLDVKNFYGDFSYTPEKLKSRDSRPDYKNPLHQLHRGITHFKQLLHSLDLSFPVSPYVVFINSDFTLYEAPLHEPMIFPTQLNQFCSQLVKREASLDKRHHSLAKALCNLHQSTLRFANPPDYEFNQLKKGIHCLQCQSFSTTVKKGKIYCSECGAYEATREGVIRSTEEFKILFPTEHVTSSIIVNWCQLDLHQKTISRILKRHYEKRGETKGIHYV